VFQEEESFGTLQKKSYLKTYGRFFVFRRACYIYAMNDENTIINGSGTASSLGTCFATAAQAAGASRGVPPWPSVGSQGPPPAGATPSRDATVPAGHSPSRRGKIARLPAALRRLLNQRLENGEAAKPLIHWLHSLPEVQAVLAAQFEGQPITPNNLTRWKQGGFKDWLEDQRALEAAAAVFEQADDLKEMAREDLADRMTLVLTAKMAMELQRINRLPDGAKKSKLYRELNKPNHDKRESLWQLQSFEQMRENHASTFFWHCNFVYKSPS
jgi:hypothetical protein